MINSGKDIFQQVQKFKPKKITCEKIKEETIFDSRTKKEFDLFHIPQAIHIPITSNKEYHEVGYLYKQVSPEVAYDLGFNYIFKNVEEIIKKALPYKNEKIIIYCSRGGIRSKTLTYLLNQQGFDVIQLESGMKAYRNFILEQLESIKLPEIIILQGLAGSRKTTLLENLNNKIDLELCAKHNSSAYGALDHEPNSQKQFLFDLFEQLKKVQNFKQIYIEGEARKIGSVIIPERIWTEMTKAKIIFLEVSLENRAKHFAETYPDMKTYLVTYIEQTNSLKKFMSNSLREKLIQLIIENKAYEFWYLILKEHYDPKYEHAFKTMNFDKKIDANDFKKTLKYLKNLERI